MKERPIIFSAPMVRAILSGTKTKTRRVVKLTDSGRVKEIGSPRNWHLDDLNAVLACPYGQPGDRLWARETWFDAESALHSCVLYRADGDDQLYGQKWRPSIHMPRWASRITLAVTGVRVERLQDISEADALAEGIVRLRDGGYAADTDGRHYHAASAWHSYGSLWEYINGPGSWDLNPWVWVVEFKRVTP